MNAKISLGASSRFAELKEILSNYPPHLSPPINKSPFHYYWKQFHSSIAVKAELFNN